MAKVYRYPDANRTLGRFLDKVFKDPDSGCWLWTAYKNVSGYGAFNAGYKSVAAHRWSYEHHKGTIPEGMVVCHSCDTPACVNPDHLWLGTPKDNSQDCSRKGRSNKPRGKHHWSHLNPEDVVQGEDHVRTKLSRDQVINIFKDNRYNHVIAKDYGVNPSCIQKIKNRINWKSISDSELE